MNDTDCIRMWTPVNRARLRVITFCLILFLPACGIPNRRQGECGPDLPETFNGAATADNSSQLGVDRYFDDSKLTSLIDQALAHNRELKILNEEVEVAWNEVQARRGAYLPFVTFGADVGLERPSLFTPLGTAEDQLQFRPGRNFPEPLGNFAGGLNFVWALDIWREFRNARDAAEQRYCAAIERRNFFATKMIAEIAENYYELMALDLQLQTLDKIIELQQQSYKLAVARKKAARGTDLPVQRFQAEVRKNQSERLIVKQEIVEAENKINFLVNRFPTTVDRKSAGFIGLSVRALSVGIPANLLLNRPDIRQAERELAAADLDIKVARAHFYPRVEITAGVGYRAFNPRYLFNPEALIYNAAGNLVAPVINRFAIRAEYRSANAKQLQALYNYQRIVLNAFTQVINRVSKVENYSKSIAIKQQQLKSLENSVAVATQLFQNTRVEYIEVLLAQRDLLEARTVLIQTKREQLSAVVQAFQALGGGLAPRQGGGPTPSSKTPVPPAPGAGGKKKDDPEDQPAKKKKDDPAGKPDKKKPNKPAVPPAKKKGAGPAASAAKRNEPRLIFNLGD